MAVKPEKNKPQVNDISPDNTMEKFPCDTGLLTLWSQVVVYSLLLIKDIPKMIK